MIQYDIKFLIWINLMIILSLFEYLIWRQRK